MNQQDKKQVTVKNGYWFFFEDDGNKIAMHGSAISGKETIYVNDEVVSETRNYKFKSDHLFEINGVEYNVEFKMKSMLKGELLCSLYRENKLLTTESKAYFQKDNKTILLTSLGAGFLVGLTIAFIFLKFFK
jgi:hypothetical protein